VIIPKIRLEEWFHSYELLVPLYPNDSEEEQKNDPKYCVVPKSSVVLFEDNDEYLLNVILFKKHLDLFKQKAIAKKFQIREFKYEKGSVQQRERKLEELKDKKNKIRIDLYNFVQTTFTDVFTCLIHLKSIRVWVESVLRYSIGTFSVMLIRPNSHKVDGKIRSVLQDCFSNLGGDMYTEDLKTTDESTSFGLVNEKFYPYVFLDVVVKI